MNQFSETSQDVKNIDKDKITFMAKSFALDFE